MKIAYCIPSLYYPGGMERVLTMKANYFAEHFGYEIHLILTDGADQAPYYPLHPSVRVHNLRLDYDKLYGLPLHRKIREYLKRQRLFRRRLNECLHEIRPDITVSMLRRDINLMNQMTDGSVKVGEVHLNYSNYRRIHFRLLPDWAARAATRLWMNRLMPKLRPLARFVVLTHEDAPNWTRHLDNVTVIHNPVSFFPEQQSDCTPKQVIAVGRYVEQKGYDLLIPAWKIVAERHPDWVLRIYGEGWREPLQAQIDALGLTSSCILESAVRDITEKYCESSLFVLSSRFEGFGVVIVEAMACGIPAVSFTCPCGPRDIISDGEDGLLAENGNIGELAEKLCQLIGNDELRRQMGLRARKNVARFRIEHIAEEWRKLFESILPQKN